MNFQARQLILVLSAFLAACESDIDLVQPSDPYPLIYCIVNPTDTFCFATVSMSAPALGNTAHFLDNTESLRVDDATISLEAWGKGYKLWESGFSLCYDSTASEVPRSVFKSDKPLLFSDPTIVGTIGGWNYEYFRLIVTSSMFKKPVYSRIPIIRQPKRSFPITPVKFDLYNPDIFFLSVLLDLKESKYASLICNFAFEEYKDHWEEKNVNFVMKKDIPLVYPALNIHLVEDAFFNKLRQVIGKTTGDTFRLFKQVSFSLLTTDRYFDDYFDTFTNSADHEQMPFTNIENGYGLFSCTRRVDFPELGIELRTLDSLVYGRFTKDLKFVKW